MRGLFVVGTDTGVGKTLVSTSLVRRWSSEGKRVTVMKPCETGGGDDAAQLVKACGRALDPALVNPYRFALPAAPFIAGRAEGRTVDFARVDDAARILARDAERIVVEGAGGLLVPFSENATCADLVARLGLPTLLVARAALGTINHTLLTVEALRRRQLPLVGVVLVRSVQSVGPEEQESLAWLSRQGFRVFGLVPFIDDQGERARTAAAAIDADAIWRAT